MQQQQKRTIMAPLSRSTSTGTPATSSSRTSSVLFGRLRGADIFMLGIVIVLAGLVGGGMFMTIFQRGGGSTAVPPQTTVQRHVGRNDHEGFGRPHAVDELEDALQHSVVEAREDAADSSPEVLVLRTEIGPIKIVLRPDLSPGSVDYIRRVMKVSDSNGLCPGCRLYRAEKPDILQGILREDVVANMVRGSCPSGFEDVPNDCPEWDPDCGCHGPVMTKGMVGWAAGSAGGPDFFINNHHAGPATWWGTQHTVWGEIQDDASLAVIDHVWTLPVEEHDGLTFLVDPLHFTVHTEMKS